MDVKGYGHTNAQTPRWVNIANLFTLARLACVPFAVQAILNAEARRALGIVLAAGITDAVDGALARRFGIATSVGAYLDPITDKIFLSATYISLAVTSGIPWWLVIEIFTRDFLILAFSGAAILFTRLRRFPPTIWGKVSTFLQIALALAILIRNASPGITPAGPPDALVWTVAAVTALSGIHYVWRGLREVARKPPGVHPNQKPTSNNQHPTSVI